MNCTKCRNVNMKSLTFQRLLCPSIIFYRNKEPFLRYAIDVPYFWLWFSKTYSACYYNTIRNTHIEFQVTRLKVKVIMTHKQTIVSSAIALKFFNLHIPTVDEKRELHVELLVKRSKVNLSATFWVHLFSDRIS